MVGPAHTLVLGRPRPGVIVAFCGALPHRTEHAHDGTA
jgi:hypothetical protein